MPNNRKLIRGRVSPIALIGTIGVVLLVFLLFFVNRDSSGENGKKFMDALARGDAKTLADLSHLPGLDAQQREAAWKKSVTDYGKHYVFAWKVISVVDASETTSAIKLQVNRDLMSQSSYPENFELPMVKADGKWKVDVRRIDRRLYPGMPR